MLETTESVNLFLPIIFALFVSYGVGSIFNKSLYIGALRTKNIPLLNKTVPSKNKKVTAGEVCSSPVKYLNAVSNV